MHRFTDEGRRAQQIPCLASGGKHALDPVMAEQDTFYCLRCGAVAKDSVWYDMEEAPDGKDDRGEVPGL
ncbi:hypothetical protein [Actinomadura sediminis]|uniref:Uncharacterized protein n=1 Tax=Actinomadura sediminis TaxID=1038904 RepID=A0ABW3ESW9_9ACTN